MALSKLFNLLIKYNIDDYVVYLGPNKDLSVLMRVFDIIDATYDDVPFQEYELVLLEPMKSNKGKKDEVWAKYEEVRPLTKKEAKLIRVLYE